MTKLGLGFGGRGAGGRRFYMSTGRGVGGAGGWAVRWRPAWGRGGHRAAHRAGLFVVPCPGRATG